MTQAPNKPPVVLVDASYVAHRARCSVAGPASGDDGNLVAFLVLDELRRIGFDRRIASNQVHLFLDSRTSLRSGAYPGYKRKRRANRRPEEVEAVRHMHAQLGLLRGGMLADVGFGLHCQSGYESDDLMASAALNLDAYPADRRGVMVTADKDLLQAVNRRVDWYDHARERYLDQQEACRWKRLVGPADWASVLSIAGCPTDNVTGVPGVGEKTATDYLWHLLPEKSGRRRAIESDEGQRVIARNRPLVTLPYPGAREVRPRDVSYDPKAFFRWCERLGFKQFVDGPRRESWERFLAGDMAGGGDGRRDRQVPRAMGERRART